MIYRTDIILNSVFVPSWEPHIKVLQTLMEVQSFHKRGVVYTPRMVELTKPDTLSTYWKTSWGAKRAQAWCADFTCVRTTRVTQVDYMTFPNYTKYALASSAMRETEEREGVLV